MDVNVQFMSDTAERRRTQNRLAQRKFRGERPFPTTCLDHPADRNRDNREEEAESDRKCRCDASRPVTIEVNRQQQSECFN